MTTNMEIDIHANCIPIKEHFLALLEANDRRYTEIDIEKEKALKIKDEGDREARKIKEDSDKTALGLAREIQTYKDEAHNGLLKQWQAERGTYVTSDKFEGSIKPLAEYVTSQTGRGAGLNQGWIYLLGGLSLIATILAIIGFFKP